MFMNDDQTGGRLLITQVANGFLVSLPRKASDAYSRMAQGFIPAIREARGEGETDVERIIRENNEKPVAVTKDWEMTPVGNCFVFKTWQEVLDFLREDLVASWKEAES